MSSQVSGSQRRGLEDAASYCLRNWFPVNGKVFSAVRESLKTGRYENNTKLFLSDLCKDSSLTLHLMKEIQSRSLTGPPLANPLEAIMSLSNREILDVLGASESHISIHSMFQLPKIQALRLKNSVSSTATTALLASKTGVNPVMAIGASSVRQLGLSLVAFNYPNLYQRAIIAQGTGGAGIDEALFRLLGFTPVQLTRKVLDGWRINPFLKAIVDPGVEVTDEVETVLELCRLGEAVGRLGDPEHYPNALDDWTRIGARLEEMLGPNALELINDAIKSASSGYVDLSPEIFEKPIIPEESIERANEQFGNHLLSQNQWAMKCPERIRDILNEAYRLMRYSKVSGEAMMLLANKCIPEIGFPRGCIYLVDPKTMNLIPKLRIGTLPLQFYQSLVHASGGEYGNSIAACLYSTYPLSEEFIADGEPATGISWSIGDTNRAGVLHLQLGAAIVQDPELEPLLCFKAIRQAVNDCLNFRGTAS